MSQNAARTLTSSRTISQPTADATSQGQHGYGQRSDGRLGSVELEGRQLLLDALVADISYTLGSVASKARLRFASAKVQADLHDTEAQSQSRGMPDLRIGVEVTLTDDQEQQTGDNIRTLQDMIQEGSVLLHSLKSPIQVSVTAASSSTATKGHERPSIHTIESDHQAHGLTWD